MVLALQATRPPASAGVAGQLQFGQPANPVSNYTRSDRCSVRRSRQVGKREGDLCSCIQRPQTIVPTGRRYVHLEEIVQKEDASPSGATVESDRAVTYRVRRRRLVKDEIQEKCGKTLVSGYAPRRQLETKEAEEPLTAAIQLIVSVTSKDETSTKIKSAAAGGFPGAETRHTFNPDLTFYLLHAQRDFNAAREILGQTARFGS